MGKAASASGQKGCERMKNTTKKYRPDNRGAALISVVVAILFIVILGTALLYSSLTGMNVKSAERRTEDAFYDADTVMEELRAGVALRASKAMETAYTDVFTEFASERLADGVSPQTVLAEKMLELLQQPYGSETVALIGGRGDTYSIPLMASFLDGKVSGENNVRVIELDGGTAYLSYNGNEISGKAIYTPPVIVEGDNTKSTTGSITFKNVDVSFVAASGFESAINTDIVINIPDFYARAVTSAGSVSGYSLSTDGVILSDSENGSSSIKGDVFAGGNSNGLGGGISGSVYVGRGSALTMSEGSAYFGGAVNVGTADNQGGTFRFGESDSENELWAKEIVVGSKKNNSTTHNVDVSANTYIQDDLIVLSDNSSVTLSGSYTGFGADKTGDSSSAIVINGKAASLDFDKLDALTLAGVGYIDIFKTRTSELTSDSYNQNDNKNPLPNGNSIPMGQSFVAKSDQLAYLVPAECLKNYPTNPYYFTYSGTGELPDPKPDMKKELFGDSSVNNGKTLADYVSEGEIKTLYKILDAPSKTYIAYVFMVFDSQDNANRYFKDYFTMYPEKVGGYLSNYLSAVDKLTDEDAAVSVNGNIYCTEDGKLSVKQGNAHSNGSYMSTLFKNNTSNNPYKRLINSAKVAALSPGVYTFKNGDTEAVIVNGSTYECGSNSSVKYIVGNNSAITVNGNFSGCIISGGIGSINLVNASVSPIESDDYSAVMSSACTGAAGKFSDYINGVGGDSEGQNNSWNVERMITYANWSKR